MNLHEIRTAIITAIGADDELMEQLVFKGGNALEIVHKIGNRASLDMDFSISEDLRDVAEFEARLFRSLRHHFDSAGLVLFDQRFGPRPTNRLHGDLWGGYNAEFKLIERDRFESLGGKLEDIRRQAITMGAGQQRKFRIEISAFEYCEDKIAAEVDHYTVYVYSIDMIAVEKLRAICQQSPSYELRVHPTPRARDFYDIHAAVVDGGVSFASPEVHELIGKVFQAKTVPLYLLGEIHEHREFHRADWPAVQDAVRVRLRQFDYYFEFVLAEVEKLQPLWVK